MKDSLDKMLSDVVGVTPYAVCLEGVRPGSTTADFMDDAITQALTVTGFTISLTGRLKQRARHQTQVTWDDIDGMAILLTSVGDHGTLPVSALQDLTARIRAPFYVPM